MPNTGRRIARPTACSAYMSDNLQKHGLNGHKSLKDQQTAFLKYYPERVSANPRRKTPTLRHDPLSRLTWTVTDKPTLLQKYSAALCIWGPADGLNGVFMPLLMKMVCVPCPPAHCPCHGEYSISFYPKKTHSARKASSRKMIRPIEAELSES